MTDNEQRLRRVLVEESAGVLPAADAWANIRAGVVRRRRTTRWYRFAGATATAAAAAATVFAISGSPSVERRPAASPSAPATTASAAPPAPTSQPTGQPMEPAATPTSEPTSQPTSVASEPGGVPAGVLREGFVTHRLDGTAIGLALMSKNDGMLVRPLTGNSGVGSDSAPVASPDGKHVYFLRVGGKCESGIYRLPLPGGPAEKIVDGKESVIAFALNGDGTRLAALRYAECNAGGATLLIEYDARTGEQVRQLNLPAVANTVATGLAWNPNGAELAIVRSGQGETADRVDLLPLPGSSAQRQASTVTGLPTCMSGGIRHVLFTADALYLGRDCMDPENAKKSGHIYRVPLNGPQLEAELLGTSPDGTAVAGVQADDDGRVVFTSVRWLEEELAGPTSVWRLGPDGSPPHRIYESAERLLGLAW